VKTKIDGSRSIPPAFPGFSGDLNGAIAIGTNLLLWMIDTKYFIDMNVRRS